MGDRVTAAAPDLAGGRSIEDQAAHALRAIGGERFAERALTAAGTRRLQHRSLFTYLSELTPAHTRGDPFPAPAT
jgi:hypothetical protein